MRWVYRRFHMFAGLMDFLQTLDDNQQLAAKILIHPHKGLGKHYLVYPVKS